MTAKLNLVQKALLLVAAGAVLLVNFKPSEMLRGTVLKQFGNPAYEGMWVLIPHVFLYSTLTAGIAMLAWWALARPGWIARPWFAPLTVKSAGLGLLVGLVTAGVLIGFVSIAAPGTLHAPEVNPWLAAGNLFSNLYEEIIFRGFLLAALAAVFGFWPAAVLTSIAFGAVHTQYPLEFQIFGAMAGLAWCWLVRSAKSLWAPWLSHTVLDLAVDPFI